MEITRYLPHGLLSSFIVKCLFVGVSLPEMGIAVSLVGLVAVKEYLERFKTLQEVQEFVKKETSDMKAIISTQNEVIEKMARALDEQRNAVSGIKLSHGIKQRMGT